VCLQVDAKTSGSGTEVWACNGSGTEEWNIVKDAAPKGYFQLQTAGTGTTLCLDAAGTTSGSAVEGVTCNSQAAQQWKGTSL